MATDGETYDLVPNKTAKSDIWQYYLIKRRKADRSIVKAEAVCTLCEKVIRYSGGGTTNLKTHIDRHHPSKVTRNIRASAPKPPIITDSNNNSVKQEIMTNQPTKCEQRTLADMFTANKKYPAHSVRATSISNAVARFIVKDLRPYSVVSNTGFKDLIYTLDSKYCIPSRQFFSDRKIPEMYECVKAEVKSDLSRASKIALTTDGWTSRATESYVTITASFINDWTMKNYVLQTRELPVSHTGNNIASVLIQACEEWGIPQHPPLVTDNASNMTVAATEAGCNPHIGCYAHTLNLAAQKALKLPGVNKILAKIRKIVSFFHRSTTAAAVLNTKIEQLGLPKHKLIMDVCTRWNSAADMLERFLELQPAVYASLASKEIKNVSKDIAGLLESNIDVAEDVLACLKPLRTVTTALCTEETPTISIIMPLQHQLLCTLMVEKDTDSTLVKEMKQAIVENLSPRYTENRLFLQRAALLDPRFKNMTFLSEDERFQRLNEIVAEAASLKEQHRVVKVEPKEPEMPDLPCLPVLPELNEAEITPAADNQHGVKEECSTSQPPTSMIEVPVPVPKKMEESKHGFASIFSDTDLQITRVEKKTFLELATAELTAYKSAPCLTITENPLKWWREWSLKLPLLGLLAKNVLCIPATSVPSERVFSTAGDIVSAQRANLKPHHVDKLIFLKKNMK